MTDRRRLDRRWLLVAAVVAMAMAGTYQFVWSSVRLPLADRLAVTEATLGTIFTGFVVAQTVAQFPAGWLRDRRGPRLPLAVGGLLLGVGYAGVATAGTTLAVGAFYTIGGLGAGAAYTVAVNTPVKWFSDRRGLATGVVGFAYSGASVLLIPLVRGRLTAEFRLTMLGLAALGGLLTLAAVPFLRDPGTTGTPDAATTPASGADAREPGAGTDGDAGVGTGAGEPVGGYAWHEAVRTWQFWLLYGVFVVVNGVGLMVIGKIVAFAEAFGLSTAATAAATVVALGDGVGVVVGGGLSDRLGGERTMVMSLAVCGLALAAATLAADAGRGLLFVVFIAVTTAARSPAFAVFPSLVGEYYGTARSSENYAVLYSAKLWGGVVGGTVTSALVAAVGWQPTFLAGAALLFACAGGMAALRPVDPDRLDD